jgi:hypothetical protein
MLLLLHWLQHQLLSRRCGGWRRRRRSARHRWLLLLLLLLLLLWAKKRGEISRIHPLLLQGMQPVGLHALLGTAHLQGTGGKHQNDMQETVNSMEDRLGPPPCNSSTSTLKRKHTGAPKHTSSCLHAGKYVDRHCRSLLPIARAAAWLEGPGASSLVSLSAMKMCLDILGFKLSHNCKHTRLM